MAPKLRRRAGTFTNAILPQTTGAASFRRFLDGAVNTTAPGQSSHHIAGRHLIVLRPGLLLSKPMRTKERPHQARCVDTVAGAPDEPFRQRLATGPGVASSFNGVEHHRRVVSALRVFESGDGRRYHRIDGIRSAAIPS